MLTKFAVSLSQRGFDSLAICMRKIKTSDYNMVAQQIAAIGRQREPRAI
jgi:hypothetical protein